MLIQLIEESLCAHDVHELTHYPRPWYKPKPLLPKGTYLLASEVWSNFYGSYYRCEHEYGSYDIPVSSARVIAENDDDKVCVRKGDAVVGPIEPDNPPPLIEFIECTARQAIHLLNLKGVGLKVPEGL